MNKILEEAVRDICSVSVTTASKSEVRRIVTESLTSQINDLIAWAEEGDSMTPFMGQVGDNFPDGYKSALTNLITHLKETLEEITK